MPRYQQPLVVLVLYFFLAVSDAFLFSTKSLHLHDVVHDVVRCHHQYSSVRCRSHKSSNNSNNNNNRIDKGFNLLELASAVIPQGRIVQTAKESWKFLWQRFMTELAPQDQEGNYQRPQYGFSNTLGSIDFPIETGRYHVYVGNPCPWCHRVRLVVNILGLEDLMGMTVLLDDPIKASRGGWVFDTPPKQAPKVQDLRQLYDELQPGYTGRCTAPLLVDWKSRRIVSNESKDIVRMLPLLLEAATKDTTTMLDLTPSDLISTIDETNEWVYRLLNNGVYRCGFSTKQQAYDRASLDVLQGLQRCQDILSRQDFLCHNDRFTESDLMLLPTMLRFDGVYSPLFGAGGTHIRLECDYPAIYQWMKRCWTTIPGVQESIDITDACESYYKQLFPLNPGGILPRPVTAKALRLE
ncbi:iron hydrogenase [Nitzschia inconspicua]|uniref:Iron hydrogenase n=1 Tax=Nitzschia inconspicua TaxID=303405 RepID=A0A9K3K9L5_9STRA|nr:lipoprotein, type 6 [Nitzschia inconspicua]KAG7362481.1 iron hydrogenase [Nitzschia inconspicua]